MANFLKAVIDRVEGDFLVLKISGDQEIYWPKHLLDFNYSEGETINIYLSKDELQTEEADRSKDLLRKIFQPNV